MSTILKVDDINVYYGSIHAIKGISFEVNEGEIVTLIGANGAGKSTTLNTIACLLRSKTGGIEFMGDDAISIVVSTEDGTLDAADVAKITDIAMTETGYAASAIRIMAAN